MYIGINAMFATYREQQKCIVNMLRYDVKQDTSGITMVPIRSDHITDITRCLTSVVLIPDDMAQDISQTLIEPLKKIEPEHYYYPVESLHLTVKNVKASNHPPLFGETDIKKVDQLFQEIIPRYHSFSYSLEEIVAFKTSIALIGYCDEQLRDLVQELDDGLQAIGVPDNKHLISNTVFFGNITLCRYVRQPSKHLLTAIKQHRYAYCDRLKVRQIHLITCNAVCAPKSRTLVNSYTLRM
jgi:2'-5' RNA ligase